MKQETGSITERTQETHCIASAIVGIALSFILYIVGGHFNVIISS